MDEYQEALWTAICEAWDTEVITTEDVTNLAYKLFAGRQRENVLTEIEICEILG